MKKRAVSISSTLDDVSLNQYFNSRPIDVHWVSEYPEIQNVTNQIVNEVLVVLKYEKMRNDYLSQIRKHIQLVILDVYVAYLTDPNLYVSFSRSKDNYHNKSRYEKLYISYTFLIGKAIDPLIKLGYLEGKLGFKDRESGKGYQSRIRANPKLIELIKQNNINSCMIDRHELEDMIQLRSEKDEYGNYQLIDYDDTKETDRMRDNLEKINDFLFNTFIDIYLPNREFAKLQDRLTNSDNEDHRPINLFARKLHRVFNNNGFDQGGRFYGGWWQYIPREYRKFIRIGSGKEGAWPKYSVEYDYNAQHIRMLYADIGIDYGKNDPFDVADGNEQIRKIVKQAFYSIVNCKNEEQAIEAVDYQIRGGKKGKKKFIDKSKKIKLPIGIHGAEDIVELLREHHKPIQDYLYSGQGIYLQRRDSDIAEKVMLRMMELGARALPVHDSFLVTKSFDIDIPREMKRIFKDEVGVYCPVSRKETNQEYRARTNPPKGIEDDLWEGGSERLENDLKREKIEYSQYYDRLKTYQKIHVYS